MSVPLWTAVSVPAAAEVTRSALHQTGADSEVLLCRFVVFHEIMPSMDALPVKVPFPRHEPSALFAELPSQHRVTKIRKHLVGIFQANSFQRRSTFKDPHILLDLCGSLRDRPKLPIHFSPRNIRWSETDDAVSVNRAERLLVPFDVNQPVLQQPCIQLPVQELPFYLLQKSFLLRCEFFVHIIPPIFSALFERKKGWSLVRENQQSSAHNFVKDFSSIFPKSHSSIPLKKDAGSKKSLNMEKQRFKTPAIRDFIYGVT